MENTNNVSDFDKRFGEVTEKVTGSMLVLARMDINKEGKEQDFFTHVKESYTHDELAYLTSVYIGERLQTALTDNPQLGNLIKLIRQAELLTKRMSEDEQKN